MMKWNVSTLQDSILTVLFKGHENNIFFSSTLNYFYKCVKLVYFIVHLAFYTNTLFKSTLKYNFKYCQISLFVIFFYLMTSILKYTFLKEG